ncbi:related to ribosomal protein YML6, mitochondrial [Ramularia collo-cygni]|uniref:Large ribosomal subunit protein uL4m n=1 Tax=Ramularia collo-cygni TaxID=112498 RepID=A0A2D3VCX5_9PEZI|nr:related to ribosomal protein YML6, mitochondrial [Ramularia collo-cygni]CZT23585.1 related to ribosomal protein YML6, mitochondrial [Ramularia collo-cygni]
MASKRAAIPAKHLFTNFQATQHPAARLTRSMATEAPLSTTSTHAAPPSITSTSTSSSSKPTLVAGKIPNPFLSKVPCTLYTFPSLTPTSLTSYPSQHLLLPLRRDILHRAVIFEGDATRQGTASTKHRSEVHGSGRKIRPQKGSGSARLGDKKSPMLRGGGVAFGPKPRDFSTAFNKKDYCLAVRTALSARYRRGEMMVVEGEMRIEGVGEWGMERYVREMVDWNGLQGSLFVKRFVGEEDGFIGALQSSKAGKGLSVDEVDVKDLLSGKRVVIERRALEMLFGSFQADLVESMRWKSSFGGDLLEWSA